MNNENICLTYEKHTCTINLKEVFEDNSITPRDKMILFFKLSKLTNNSNIKFSITPNLDMTDETSTNIGLRINHYRTNVTLPKQMAVLIAAQSKKLSSTTINDILYHLEKGFPKSNLEKFTVDKVLTEYIPERPTISQAIYVSNTIEKATKEQLIKDIPRGFKIYDLHSEIPMDIDSAGKLPENSPLLYAHQGNSTRLYSDVKIEIQNFLLEHDLQINDVVEDSSHTYNVINENSIKYKGIATSLIYSDNDEEKTNPLCKIVVIEECIMDLTNEKMLPSFVSVDISNINLETADKNTIMNIAAARTEKYRKYFNINDKPLITLKNPMLISGVFILFMINRSVLIH